MTPDGSGYSLPAENTSPRTPASHASMTDLTRLRNPASRLDSDTAHLQEVAQVVDVVRLGCQRLRPAVVGQVPGQGARVGFDPRHVQRQVVEGSGEQVV